jgi:8-oxo-dGTP pyrophosphatase MutT (NUDIX family)
MKKLFELSDEDIGLKTISDAKCVPRTSARAIVKKGNLIALLHVRRDKYYKLPGGGVESDETIEESLRREILEEIGCTIKITKEVGEIIEYRSLGKMAHTSHCFIAEVIKEGKPEFTDFEIKHGFEVVWVTMDKAIELVKNSDPTDYNGKFIVKRELIFLNEANDIMKNVSYS